MPKQRHFLGPAVALAVLVTTAYLTSFTGAFVFDDFSAIVGNPTIRDLTRLDQIFTIGGAHGATVDGRPLLNFSLALNYAISGTDPWSYHALNLAIHVSATLALWGILRHTLRQPVFGLVQGSVSWLGFAAALLWAVHPLQTAAVTYVVQRAESLMGLCYFLTLYFFLRGAESARPIRWHSAAFVACLAGMACKEVMASAPLIVLLYDRTFLAGSWQEVWRRRSRVHVALISTWILLWVLMASTESRGGTAGFGAAMSSWAYALTQCRAIVHYLQLAAWPHPLVFDYGTAVDTRLVGVALQAAVLVALIIGTAWALRRKPALGFLGAWFFLILAPSSSVVPVASQTIAEHRMYLPLAALAVLAVMSCHRFIGPRLGAAFLVSAVGLGALTAGRNTVYRSELNVWSDTAAHRPQNSRAHANLGIALLGQDRINDAIASFERALQLDPAQAATYVNLCDALRRAGRFDEAIAAGEAAARLQPNSVNAHINLAHVLAASARTEAAAKHFEQALRLEPDAPDVHRGLAAALLTEGDLMGATRHFEIAARLNPEDAATWCELARARLQGGDPAAAQQAAERALQLKPDFPEVLFVLGNLAAKNQDFSAALTHFRRAVEVEPGYVAARNNLANVLLVTGQVDLAIDEYQRVLRENPDDQSVRENLARAFQVQRSSPRGSPR